MGQMMLFVNKITTHSGIFSGVYVYGWVPDVGYPLYYATDTGDGFELVDENEVPRACKEDANALMSYMPCIDSFTNGSFFSAEYIDGEFAPGETSMMERMAPYLQYCS